MATKWVNVRIIVTLQDDTGEEPVTSIDETYSQSAFLVEHVDTEQIATAASDQASLFTDASALIYASKDNSFDLRLAAGETLLEDLVFFAAVSNNVANGVHQTSVLLSGNGINNASVRSVRVEKQAP